MADVGFKQDLLGYLRGAREALLWKLEGLGEFDVRRPLTPTGTNLLGLVKHNASTHHRYFGVVFGRSLDVVLPWSSSTEPNADLWATADESRVDIVSWYRRTCEAADAVVAELSLDAPGEVPWWGGERVTLHHVLTHVTAETQRHAGHADIVRELIDGSTGLLAANRNLPTDDPGWWTNRNDRITAAAHLADRGEVPAERRRNS